MRDTATGPVAVPFHRTEPVGPPLAPEGHRLSATPILLVLVANLVAQEDPLPPAYEAKVHPILTQRCATCHGGDDPDGHFRIADLDPDGDVARWQRVREQIATGAMPPKRKARLAAAEVSAIVSWIDARTIAHRTAEGRVVLRRLNRVEYENTVRDLLDVEVSFQDLLPEDAGDRGFDNVGDALHTSSFLLERYLDAADRALDSAIANGPQPWIFKQRIPVRDEHPSGDVYRKLEDGSLAIFSSWISANINLTVWQFTAKFHGRYRFAISAYGYHNPGKPATFSVSTGGMQEITDQHLVGYYDVPDATPTVIEFTDLVKPNDTLRIVAEGLGVTPPTVQKVGADNYQGPGLAVQWVDVEGPLLKSWPPPSHTLIFGDLPREKVAGQGERFETVSKAPAADAERILRRFAARAFRREVSDDDVAPYIARAKQRLAEGYSFEQAVRVGLKAILVSPDFLFLHEKPGKLDDVALASRLSYFLWSSMPDEELLTLARRKELGRPETLRAQVERLLKDPKAAAFTKNFVGQWLSLRNIDATIPDAGLYPEFDDGLKESMAQEPPLFFDAVLKDDLSLTSFVASDFSMLNGPLATLYGIPGVEGRNFRRVALPPGSHRGGVMTMAAVLKVTANGTTTSPVLRGAWILDRILGTTPPRPPGDVPAVEPDIRGATTIREQLAKHRDVAACASCHQQIDPPGFALESFDVIGGWRDRYRSLGAGEPVDGRGYRRGPAVDPADVLPDGRRFQDIDGFKQLLLADRDQLARALAEKLTIYATGGTLAAVDRKAIDEVVRAVGAKGYGFRTLVHEIVQSPLFRTK